MIVLAIDSSTSPVSCAILDNEKVICETFLNIKTTHSQTLLPAVKQMMTLSNFSIKQVDYIAVTNGPGSFTGIRIGISLAKGLAAPFNTPCVQLSSLEALAYNVQSDNCIICSAIDARCQQVYNSIFIKTNGKIERIVDDRALLIDELKQDIQKIQKKNQNFPIFVVGDGANLVYNTLDGVLPNLQSTEQSLQNVCASSVGLCAVKKIETNNFVNSFDLMPVYLKLPQAERELKSKQL